MANAHAISGGVDPVGNQGFDSASGMLVLQRMRAEYLEMPGLSLDVPQAARLWNIPAALSESLLVRLREDGFLAKTATGRYIRA